MNTWCVYSVYKYMVCVQRVWIHGVCTARMSTWRSISDLPLGVAEDDGLCDGQSVVQITQSVKLPLLSLHSHEELLYTLQSQLITGGTDGGTDGEGDTDRERQVVLESSFFLVLNWSCWTSSEWVSGCYWLVCGLTVWPGCGWGRSWTCWSSPGSRAAVWRWSEPPVWLEAGNGTHRRSAPWNLNRKVHRQQWWQGALRKPRPPGWKTPIHPHTN